MKTLLIHGVSLAVLATVGTTAAMPASAQGAAAPLVLPAQPLAETLRAIGERSGAIVRADPRDVRGIRARAVNATDPRTAIAQAIEGTSLAISGTAENGFYVGRPGVGAEDDGDIVVVAQRNEAETRYLVRTTATSTRDGRTLKEQPQSAAVISSRLIRDQQVQTVAEALRNAAGATVNLANAQGAASFTVRGFFAKGLTGGLVDPGGLAQPVANVERIEVLKGPAALLAGGDNLGGSVNIVTKKPVAQPLLELTAEYGSFDDRRIALDGSTALNADKTVSARLVVQHARADRNAAGYDGRFENLVSPSLRYKDATFDLTAGIDFSDVRQPTPPFGAYGPGDRRVAFDRPIGPEESGIRLQNRRFYYDGQWDAATWLSIVSRSHYSETDTRLTYYGLVGPGPDASFFIENDEKQQAATFATDTYARLRFDTGPLSHRVSAGISYSDFRVTSLGPVGGAGIALVDIFGNAPPTVPFEPFRPAVEFSYASTSEQLGFYGQDLIELGPVHLLAAVRRNRVVSTSRVSGLPNSRDKASTTTPQVGVVVDLTPRLSVYANHIQGFQPSFLLDRAGNPLPVRETRNVEGGLKWDIAPDRLAFTASVFRIKETNVPVAIAGVFNRYDVLDGQVSKGVEADLTGEIARGWNVAASYSYATFELENPQPNFAVVPGQPRHKYSVFSRYTVPSGPLADLGVSAGVYGFSSSFVDFRGRLALPTQTRVDANLYYRIGRMSANLGVVNLLDDDVYGVTQVSSYVPLTPQRTYRLTLTYSLF